MGRTPRRLKDIDPEERGISWNQYMENWWKQMRKETDAARSGEEPEINRKRIATSRDNYGWRSLPPSSHSLFVTKKRAE